MGFKLILIKTIFIYLFGLLFIIGCNSKGDKNNNDIYTLLPINFRIKWKSDSLGTKGFRERCYNYDSSLKTWLIKGINIDGFSITSVIATLGKPTIIEKGKEDNLPMLFYIIKRGDQYNSIKLQIFFNKQNKVEGILQNIGN